MVIPVHRVEEYLPECLDSILEQPFRNVEVVAVDDASPDGCGTLLDKYAAADPRVVVVHQDTNEGAGAARNTGAARAGGDYLIFLDGDDTLAEGALAAIAERVEALGRPEVLLLDHARTYPSGARRPSGEADLLQAAGDEVFAPSQRPEYLRHFTLVTNRAYRRDFYTAHGFAFPDGLYEDDVIAYRTMLTSTRTGCLPRVAFEYRQRATGNAMHSRGRAHFAILTQYEDVFSFLDEHPDLAPIKPAIFEQLITSVLYLLTRPDRINPPDRPAFFREAHRTYRRLRPPHYTPPRGRAGLRHRALARGAWPVYQLMTLTTTALRNLRRPAPSPRT